MTSRAVVLVGIAAFGAAPACRPSGAVEASRPPVAVEVASAELGDLAETIDVVGTLAPKLSADVKSEYSGIVAAVHVTEWVAVREGQPLATLDTREGQAALDAARAALLQAKVAQARAVREKDRAESLLRAGLMTRQGLEDAATARDAAVAAVAAAEAQLAGAETRLAKSVLRAPFDGVVASRGVNVGDRVESMGSGDPLFRIVDDRLLDLDMSVPSARLGALRVGQGVEFTVDAFPGRTFQGRVRHINPSVDPVSRAGRVMAQVGNAGHELKGGFFVKGRIQVGTRKAVVRVPRAALQEWDPATGAAAVFVIEGESARRREVHTGVVSGDAVEVARGLAAGESVATRGAFGLRDGDRVKAVAGSGA
jgi:RND family efflux transporter MFP subunit